MFDPDFKISSDFSSLLTTAPRSISTNQRRAFLEVGSYCSATTKATSSLAIQLIKRDLVFQVTFYKPVKKNKIKSFFEKLKFQHDGHSTEKANWNKANNRDQCCYREPKTHEVR